MLAVILVIYNFKTQVKNDSTVSVFRYGFFLFCQKYFVMYPLGKENPSSEIIIIFWYIYTVYYIIHSKYTGYTHKIQIIHKIVVWIREMLRNKWEKCTWLWDETMQMYECWRNKAADNRTDNKTQLSNGMNNLHSNNQELSSLSSENISFLMLEFFFLLLISVSFSLSI